MQGSRAGVARDIGVSPAHVAWLTPVDDLPQTVVGFAEAQEVVEDGEEPGSVLGSVVACFYLAQENRGVDAADGADEVLHAAGWSRTEEWRAAVSAPGIGWFAAARRTDECS